MKFKNIFVTGGAGYVGAVLIPKLLDLQYKVTVLDLMIYGENVLPDHPLLQKVKGDIRDQELLKDYIPGHDAVIHLACISNDPSFELNPDLGKSINYDAFEPLVKISKENSVQRFIYASSSSVYGIKDEPDIHEGISLEPLTDYSKFKAMCEETLAKYQSDELTTVTIRPATVCGYSPRLRLDLTVNILTSLAINRGEITVFGGQQKRPNIHIEDVTDLYCQLLELPKEKIAGKVFNAGYENHKVAEIAAMVRKIVGEKQVKITTTPTDDHRSYHISSEKIRKELEFEPSHTIENAVEDLKRAFKNKLIGNPDDSRYYNVKLMREFNLT